MHVWGLQVALDRPTVVMLCHNGDRTLHLSFIVAISPVVLLSTHADRQGVDISVTVCFCVFVRLRISPPRIKIAASNFARRFISVQCRESLELFDITLWWADAPGLSRTPATEHVTLYCAWRSSALTTRPQGQVPRETRKSVFSQCGARKFTEIGQTVLTIVD